MPVRPKLQPARVARINCVAFLLSDGTAGFTGDEVFPDRESARLAWPEYRRETWEHTCRGALPYAAEVFDGLTTAGHAVVWSNWNASRFPLDRVLDALAEDRTAVQQFRQRDPKGARMIADFLDAFEAHFTVIEQEARRLASADGPAWSRGYPHKLSSGTRYGDVTVRR